MVRLNRAVGIECIKKKEGDVKQREKNYYQEGFLKNHAQEVEGTKLRIDERDGKQEVNSI